MQVNPKWAEYQRVVNEGGEGYNPHPKYITTAAPSQAKKMYKAKDGCRYTEAQVRNYIRIETENLSLPADHAWHIEAVAAIAKWTALLGEQK
jgi:hypothetical protein